MGGKKVASKSRNISRSGNNTPKQGRNIPKSSRGKAGFQNDSQIVSLVHENNYTIVDSDGDGNCLFRSLSTGITGDEASHHKMRNIVVAELARAIPKALALQEEREKEKLAEKSKKGRENQRSVPSSNDSDGEELGSSRSVTRRVKAAALKARKGKDTNNFGSENIDPKLPIPDYNAFVLTPYPDYCAKMSSSSVWGGHLEIQAFSNVFGIKLIVLQDLFPPITVNPDKSIWGQIEPNIVLYLLYRGSCHYDAILPTDQRVKHWSHSSTQLQTHKTTITSQNTLAKDIDFDLSLLEPITNSWWLTDTGKEQCQIKRDTKQVGYKKWSYDSESDALSDNDDDEDCDDDNDGAVSTTSARHHNHDNSNCGDNIADGDTVKRDRNMKKDKKEKKATKQDTTLTIPTLQFVFPGQVIPPTILLKPDVENTFETFMANDNKMNGKNAIDKKNTLNIVNLFAGLSLNSTASCDSTAMACQNANNDKMADDGDEKEQQDDDVIIGSNDDIDHQINPDHSQNNDLEIKNTIDEADYIPTIVFTFPSKTVKKTSKRKMSSRSSSKKSSKR